MSTEEINKSFGEFANRVRKDKTGGIIMLHDKAKRCNACGEELARAHFTKFTFEGGSEGHASKSRYWWYCDCACGQGTITGWYPTKDEAIEAWNKRIMLTKNTATVDGRG